ADRASEGIAIAVKDAQIIASAGQVVDPASHEGAPNTYAAKGAQYYHPRFHHSAIFLAKTGSSLLFLVALSSRWAELTQAQNFDITLSDDRGREFRPARVVSTRPRVILTSMVLSRSDVPYMVLRTPQGQMAFTHPEA